MYTITGTIDYRLYVQQSGCYVIMYERDIIVHKNAIQLLQEHFMAHVRITR